MSYLTYNPSFSRYPVRQFTNPISIQSPDAIEMGFRFWRFSWQGTLSELQYRVDGVNYLFSSANGCTLSQTGMAFITPNLQAISDGVLTPSGSERIGNNDSNQGTLSAQFTLGIRPSHILIWPQCPNWVDANNLPGTLSVSYSTDGITYSTPQIFNVSNDGTYKGFTSIAQHGFTSGSPGTLRPFLLNYS